MVAVLSGCGQKGPLFMPASDEGRATLPQTLIRVPAAPASAPPATGTAAPVRTP